MPRTDHRRRNRPPSTTRPLRFEALEDRQMLSITVTNLDDAGPGSLRAAILQANIEAGPETIEFDAALVGTIELTSGELVITDSITINGPGPDRLTIDANEQSRVFNIDDGMFLSILDVEIAGLTITGGNTTGDGGGIHSRENLTVTNSTISDNTARDGGGIYAKGDVTVANSTISGNSARRRGGGICAYEGDVTVANSTISGNTAAFDDGGGIRAEDSDVTVNNSTISGNAARRGGGIYAYGGDVTVANSTISGNTAGDGAGIHAYDVTVTNSTISDNTARSNGGGIYTKARRGNVTVTSSTISGNTARVAGGGIWAINRLVPNFVEVTITGSILSGNTADGQVSGDVSVRSSLNNFFRVNHSLIGLAAADMVTSGSRNIITDDPQLAPLDHNGGPTKTHALLTGSPAIDAGDPDFSSPPQFDQRGAPRVIDGDGDAAARIDIGAYERQTNADLLLVVDTAIDESDGDYGPGDLSLREAIELANDRFDRVTIGFDTAGVFGAAQTILLTMGELKVTGVLTIDGPGPDVVTIDANGQSRIFNIDDGFTRTRVDIQIGGLTITGGRTNRNGGGIFSRENLTIVNSLISGNSALGRGGGIYAYSPADLAVTINDSTISDNTAGEGGGIHARADRDVDVTVTRSTISGNTADEGGGIYAYSDGDDVAITMSNSTISGNTARYSGGGIHADADDEMTVKVTLSTISGNSAGSGGGGIYAYAERDEVHITMSNSTISGNTAGSGGGGIYAYSESDEVAITMSNSTISGNSADNGGGISAYADDHVHLTVTGSILSGNTAGGQVPGDVGIAGASRFAANHSLIGLAAADMVTAGGDNVIDDNPQLAPLADNGGPTETHALLPGSPAIDAGDPDAVAGEDDVPLFDQRGAPFARVVSGRVDIGAYEFGASNAADLTGNGFVDFEDLTVLLAIWNRNVSASAGNLVDAAGTPVNFEDLTVLLAAWTGPGPAGAPVGRRLAAAHATSTIDTSNSVSDSEPEAPRQAAAYGSATGAASYRRAHRPSRRIDTGIELSAHDSPLRRIQAAAIDRAMADYEAGAARRDMFWARRSREA